MKRGNVIDTHEHAGGGAWRHDRAPQPSRRATLFFCRITWELGDSRTEHITGYGRGNPNLSPKINQFGASDIVRADI
jgi:hypothetical protein